MWAAWTSASSTDAAAAPAPSVSAALASAPCAASPASQFPQWRLLTTVPRHISVRWSRLPPLSKRLATAAGAVAVAALVGAAVLPRGTGRPRASTSSEGRGAARKTEDGKEAPSQLQQQQHSPAPTAAEEEAGAGDDIQFADPAESAFKAYVHRIKRQKESVLLSAIAQLESTAAELHAAASLASAEERSGTADDGRRAEVAQLTAKVHRCAVVADELLTQWICSLDGVPVRQREDLKQRRRELVQRATQLSGRIAPYLHPAPSSAPVPG